MKKVFVVITHYDELMAIYEKLEDAKKFVMSQVYLNFDEEDFREADVGNLYYYCENMDWAPDILGCGIVEWEVK